MSAFDPKADISIYSPFGDACFGAADEAQLMRLEALN
jgi:hypothetical protein